MNERMKPYRTLVWMAREHWEYIGSNATVTDDYEAALEAEPRIAALLSAANYLYERRHALHEIAKTRAIPGEWDTFELAARDLFDAPSNPGEKS